MALSSQNSEHLRSRLSTLSPIVLSPSQLDCLVEFAFLLSLWNAKFHFSKFNDPESIQNNLILPALALGVVLPSCGRFIDIGSGPGIPGIPLAVVHPNIDLTCIDSRDVSIEFIHSCQFKLGISNIRPLHGRAETLAHERTLRESFEFAIARSFGPLPILLEISHAFLRLDGHLVVHASESISLKPQIGHPDNPINWIIYRLGSIALPTQSIFPSGTVPFIFFRKTSPTPPDIPRSWKSMTRKPLEF